MPYYRAPRSDGKRLRFLRKTLKADFHDRQRGQPYLHPLLRAEVRALVPAFERALQALKTQQEVRSRRIEARNRALDEMELYLRDFWEVLKRRVAREAQPLSLLKTYGLPSSGRVPKPTTYEGWLDAAAQVVQGDVEATAVGYAPMVNPSAEEVRLRLDEVYRRAAAVAAAERAYDAAQARLVQLRAEVDEAIQDVVETLRFRLRKYDAAEQRRIMHRYGAAFRYRKEEQPAYAVTSEGEKEPG
ncbi:MAG: hypothetical protein ACP5HM_03845 [Anaerolineae bacterium]